MSFVKEMVDVKSAGIKEKEQATSQLEKGVVQPICPNYCKATFFNGPVFRGKIHSGYFLLHRFDEFFRFETALHFHQEQVGVAM